RGDVLDVDPDAISFELTSRRPTCKRHELRAAIDRQSRVERTVCATNAADDILPLVEVEGLIGPRSVDETEPIVEVIAEAEAGEHDAAVAFTGEERAIHQRPLRHLALRRRVHDLEA